MIRTSVTHLAAPRVPLFSSYHIFDVICDLLLNRHTATWNLFVEYGFGIDLVMFVALVVFI